MSLQVWLPLNGDLNNQGLSVLPSPSFNQVSFKNGKIGECIQGGVGWHLSEDILGNQWSVATWYNNANAFGEYNNILFCKNIKESTDCQIYLSILGGNALNIGVNGPSSSITYNYKFSSNTWYHIAATYNGSVASLYLNGELVAHGSVTTAFPSGRLNMQIDGRSTNNENTSTTGNINAQYNDFRLYDHCLSAKEVKEISKGLVLHYSLKGYGNPNLLLNSRNYNLNQTGTKRLSAGSQIDTSLFPLANTIGKTFTVSYDIDMEGNFSPVSDTPSWDADGNRSGPYISVRYNSGTVTYFTSHIQQKGKGRKFFNFTIPASWTSVESIAVNLEINCYPTNGQEWSIKNVKLEEGSIPTPYLPNSNESIYANMGFNSLIEYDCSGYGNDGTCSVALTHSSDSARYNCSCNFASDKKILTPVLPTSGLANSYTIAWWAKTSAISGKMFWGFYDGNHLNLYGGIYCNTGNGSSNPFVGASAPSLNVWHHYAMVGNGSTVALYVDGVLKGNATTYTAITGTRIYINGWSSGTDYDFNGLMSDFRIYVTALSADDIKQLYNTSASIDNAGNAHTYEFVEGFSPNISKNGIMENNYIHENEADDTDDLTTFHITKTQTFANQIYEV